ncbi:hypothetical protein HLASF_1379 [Halanaeroarchaeum sulfurireducens]|uniref:Uncharacterized protein n=1 Tax=Halanaeroarchaeum sulfurireducens TaxID=1604004 RepID=A0A0F7PE20_9EURY|nr:hypothetical protein HLASF_1379 [Halanaeroarchaeum sulfurireducens]ALG82258.1 hypothetical protein HLASA_1366 [Halanaeroarchaeum sulfurireducens]
MSQSGGGGSLHGDRRPRWRTGARMWRPRRGRSRGRSRTGHLRGQRSVEGCLLGEQGFAGRPLPAHRLSEPPPL